MSDAMIPLKDRLDYQKGYYDGYIAGQANIMEQIQPMLDLAKNPPPIILEKDQVPINLKCPHGQSLAKSCTKCEIEKGSF